MDRNKKLKTGKRTRPRLDAKGTHADKETNTGNPKKQGGRPRLSQTAKDRNRRARRAKSKNLQDQTKQVLEPKDSNGQTRPPKTRAASARVMAQRVQQDIHTRVKHRGLFKPGNPGNPKGNPFARYTYKYRMMLYETLEANEDMVRLAMLNMLGDALVGDHKAMKMLMDMTVGKPKKQSDMTSASVEMGDLVSRSQYRLMELMDNPPKGNPKLTDGLVQDAMSLVLAGLPLDGVADALGVGPEQWEGWQELGRQFMDGTDESPEAELAATLIQQLRRAFAMHRTHLTQHAMNSMHGSLRMLERRDPGTFGEGRADEQDNHTPDERFL